MSCSQSEQTLTESQVEAILHLLSLVSCGLAPLAYPQKKEVPEDRNPREQPFYLQLLIYLRRISPIMMVMMITATTVIPIAAITPMGDQDTTSRHTPSKHSYGSPILIPLSRE